MLLVNTVRHPKPVVKVIFMVQFVNKADFSQYNTMIGDYFVNIPEMVKLSTLSFFQVFRPIPEYDAILCEFIPDVRTMFNKEIGRAHV